MARKLLRQLALDDGRDKNGAISFAECCINILQSGCRYNKGVEKHIKRLLENREEKVCQDILLTLKKPNRDMFIPKQRDMFIPKQRDMFIPKQTAPKKRRWKERDSNQYDRKRPYYIDKRPNEYNRHRPYRENQRFRRNKRNQSNSNQMGRMEFKRRRTHARSGKVPSQSKETNGP
jgi:hypothetical protein